MSSVRSHVYFRTIIAMLLATSLHAQDPRADRAATMGSDWHDRSPHRVAVAALPGGQIQYLDWGGKGPPLVLLHGWNSNAHVFDDLAPKLSDRYRVIAISLPGFGQSDAPAPGYGLDEAADAVTGVLDHLHVGSATLVGHSFGGWIMTRIAVRMPRRASRLVFLDAAFDVNASDSIVARRPIARPSLGHVQSQAEVMTWLRRNFLGMWTPSLEAEYRGRSPEESARAALLQHIFQEARRGPDQWTAIRVPVLAICALATVSSEFPWLRSSDSAYARAQRYVVEERRPFQHAECERFRRTVASAVVLELEGHHYIFEQQQAAVVRAIRTFVPSQ